MKILLLVSLIALIGTLVTISLPLKLSRPQVAPCFQGEQPQQCAERLGDHYEVIYNPTTSQAWGELK